MTVAAPTRTYPLGRNLRGQMHEAFAQARAPRLRSMRRFAEDEIVIPDGRYKGRRFRTDRQPVSALYLDAVGSQIWTRFNATGPSQSGKTLCCFIIVMLFHLFEIRETVVVGLPDMDMAKDKWTTDILPVIESTRYRDLLPRSGAGSQGGTPRAITLTNGATLRFMSAGGGDKSRAGFTTRVLVVTETDGFDEAGQSSREGDKVSQLEARQASWPEAMRRTYLECTVSIEEGRTWQELKNGTDSRIAMPCPHCRGWSVATNSAKDRGTLVGWQDAVTLAEARENAAFCCAACGTKWTEGERAAAMRGAVLVHKGQRIEASEPGGMRIIGALPDTPTLGFRWGAVHNLFVPAADVGAREWLARQTRDTAPDPEDAERVLCQFVHALPYVGVDDLTRLDPGKVQRRTTALPRGVIPEHAEHVTLGVDCGKWNVHYTLVAWIRADQGRGAHIVDYGILDVHSDHDPVERALLNTLRQLRDLCEAGWGRRGDGDTHSPDLVLVDSGFWTDTVYAFCRESDGFAPCKGYGTGQQGGLGRSVNSRYTRPKQKTKTVRRIGPNYHVARIRNQRVQLVELDADHWKAFVQDCLRVPSGDGTPGSGAPGAITLFNAPPREHVKIAQHVAAERQVTEFVPGKGPVVKLERIGRKQNHYLDCLAYASVAGHLCGARLTDEGGEPEPEQPEPGVRQRFVTPDEQPFVIV